MRWGPLSWSVATEGSEGLGPYAELRSNTFVAFAQLSYEDLTETRSSVDPRANPSSILVRDLTLAIGSASVISSTFSFGSWAVRSTPRIVSPWSDPVSGTTSIRWVEDRTETRDAVQLFSRSILDVVDSTETRSFALIDTFFSGLIVWDLTVPRMGAAVRSTSSFEVRDRTSVRISASVWAPDWGFITARIATGTRTLVLATAPQSSVVFQDVSGSRTWVEVEPKAWLEPPRAIVGRPRRRGARLQSV